MTSHPIADAPAAAPAAPSPARPRYGAREVHQGALDAIRRRQENPGTFRSVAAALAFLFEWRPRLAVPVSLGISSLEDIERRFIDGGPEGRSEDARCVCASIAKCIDDADLSEEERRCVGVTFGVQIGQRREVRGGEAVYIDEAEELVIERGGGGITAAERLLTSDSAGKDRAKARSARSSSRRARGELSYGSAARALGWYLGRESDAGAKVPDHKRVVRTLGRAYGKIKVVMGGRELLVEGP